VRSSAPQSDQGEPLSVQVWGLLQDSRWLMPLQLLGRRSVELLVIFIALVTMPSQNRAQFPDAIRSRHLLRGKTKTAP